MTARQLVPNDAVWVSGMKGAAPYRVITATPEGATATRVGIFKLWATPQAFQSKEVAYVGTYRRRGWGILGWWELRQDHHAYPAVGSRDIPVPNGRITRRGELQSDSTTTVQRGVVRR